MARILRIYSKSKVYHIIIRGIDKQDIFYEKKDRKFFLNQLLETKKKYNYTIYAYNLMDNHVHLVIGIDDENLSTAIQSLTIRYAHYFNSKYQRIGTFVQDRFRSKNVEDQGYFLRVCRYVHRNAEKAGIAKTQDYEWSSYKEYIEKQKIIDKKILLHYFNDDINEFIKYTTNSELDDIMDLVEYEMINRLTDEELSNMIIGKFKIKSIEEIPGFFKSMNNDLLEKTIEEIKMFKATNQTQVARVTRIGRRKIKTLWDKDKKELTPNVR